jgi:hypothetical protein
MFILETFIRKNWAPRQMDREICKLSTSHDLIQLASHYWKLMASPSLRLSCSRKHFIDRRSFEWENKEKLSLKSIKRGLKLYQSDWVSLEFFYHMIFGWLINQTRQTLCLEFHLNPLDNSRVCENFCEAIVRYLLAQKFHLHEKCAEETWDQRSEVLSQRSNAITSNDHAKGRMESIHLTSH